MPRALAARMVDVSMIVCNKAKVKGNPQTSLRQIMSYRPVDNRHFTCLRFLCGMVLVFFFSGVSVAQEKPDLPHIVIERETGAVRAANRPFERWYPASLTKLMTLYVTARAIQAGEIAEGSPVVISAKAIAQPPSKMGYPKNTRLRVDAAIRILVIKSANDIAVALAESVAGTTDAFVERMNREARRLGMTDSHFANPHGLHSTDQYTSARDMALLARQMLNEFPRYAPLFKVPAIEAGGKTHHSYNLLLERFDGADGMKTGFVCAAGYNFIASATRNGVQLVAVVLGAFSQTERAVETARLLRSSFATPGGSQTVTQLQHSGESVGPASQRATMCSQNARETRYDPGAGLAKIESPELEPRREIGGVLKVATGGIDAPPSDAFLTAGLVPKGTVPVPQRRPDHVRLDIDGAPATGPSIMPGNAPGAVPVPTPRPRDL